MPIGCSLPASSFRRTDSQISIGQSRKVYEPVRPPATRVRPLSGSVRKRRPLSGKRSCYSHDPTRKYLRSTDSQKSVLRSISSRELLLPAPPVGASRKVLLPPVHGLPRAQTRRASRMIAATISVHNPPRITPPSVDLAPFHTVALERLAAQGANLDMLATSQLDSLGRARTFRSTKERKKQRKRTKRLFERKNRLDVKKRSKQQRSGKRAKKWQERQEQFKLDCVRHYWSVTQAYIDSAIYIQRFYRNICAMCELNLAQKLLFRCCKRALTKKTYMLADSKGVKNVVGMQKYIRRKQQKTYIAATRIAFAWRAYMAKTILQQLKKYKQRAEEAFRKRVAGTKIGRSIMIHWPKIQAKQQEERERRAATALGCAIRKRKARRIVEYMRIIKATTRIQARYRTHRTQKHWATIVKMYRELHVQHIEHNDKVVDNHQHAGHAVNMKLACHGFDMNGNHHTRLELRRASSSHKLKLETKAIVAPIEEEVAGPSKSPEPSAPETSLEEKVRRWEAAEKIRKEERRRQEAYRKAKVEAETAATKALKGAYRVIWSARSLADDVLQRVLFGKFDRNHDGDVSVGEIIRALREQDEDMCAMIGVKGGKIDSAKLDKLWTILQEIDKDDSKSLDPDEFALLFKRFNEENTAAKMREPTLPPDRPQLELVPNDADADVSSEAKSKGSCKRSKTLQKPKTPRSPRSPRTPKEKEEPEANQDLSSDESEWESDGIVTTAVVHTPPFSKPLLLNPLRNAHTWQDYKDDDLWNDKSTSDFTRSLKNLTENSVGDVQSDVAKQCLLEAEKVAKIMQAEAQAMIDGVMAAEQRLWDEHLDIVRPKAAADAALVAANAGAAVKGYATWNTKSVDHIAMYAWDQEVVAQNINRKRSMQIEVIVVDAEKAMEQGRKTKTVL